LWWCIPVTCKQEEQTFSRTLEKEQQDIAKHVKELSSQSFACEKDAEKALKAFVKVHKRWKWHEGGLHH
jgi:transposase